MFRNISVLLTANSGNLRSELRQAATQVDTFSKKVEASSKNTMRSAALMRGGFVAAAVAVAVALTTATVGAAKFEQQMRNVNSISYMSEAAFRATGKAVLDLSKTVPQSANDLASGLYDIASSGFQGADGLTVLRASAVAASAGMSNTANSAKAIAAVLNAYGRGAKDATDVSDALFQTVNLGVINFDELTGVIGDVVGTAAAAKVPIEDVGAAIATMTLSGVSGAEAGTSLNRVLQSLIQPSDALKSVYKQLNYESGSAALKTKGLKGVMDDLRVATGGNIDALLGLFPEIRAARGALALMNNEGKNYARVAAGISDETSRAGATQRAFREQMKATSNQIRIEVNKIRAHLITLGGSVLPVVRDVIKWVDQLGSETSASIAAAFHALEPVFHNLAQIGGDLVELLGAIAHAAGPVAQALISIGAASVFGVLRGMTALLADVTGFLADNKTAVEVLALALSGLLVPALIRVAGGLAVITFLKTLQVVTALRGGVTALTAAYTGLSAAELIATGGMTAGLAVLGLAIVSWQKAGAAADEYVNKATKGFNPLDPADAQRTIKNLQDTANASVEFGHKFQTGWGNTNYIRLGWDSIFGNADDVARKGQKASHAAMDLAQQVQNANENLAALHNMSGLGVDALRELAKTNNIDLSKPFDDSIPEISKMTDLVEGMAKKTGVGADQMQAAFGGTSDQLEALAAEFQKVEDAASTAFMGATDVLKNFKLESAADQTQKVADATDKVTSARQKLAELEQRQAGKRKRTISDSQALAHAQRDLNDALKEQSKAQSGVKSASQQLAAYYTDTTNKAKQFVKDITEATRRGVDPQLIARLLEAGPEQAAPVLEGILSDSSGRMVKLVNDSEAQLRSINEKVVLFARITHRAVTGENDVLISDMSTAMNIASQTLALGAKGTAEAIGKAIGKPSDEVKRIAAEYGIALAQDVQFGVNSTVINPPKITWGTSGPYVQGRGGKLLLDDSKAGGGLLSGRGTGTSDSMIARVSNGEYVMRAAAVRSIGVGSLDYANRTGSLPKFALGGYASTTSNTTYSSKTSHEYGTVIVQGVDMDNALRTLERKKKRNGWSGGAWA